MFTILIESIPTYSVMLVFLIACLQSQFTANEITFDDVLIRFGEESFIVNLCLIIVYSSLLGYAMLTHASNDID